MDGETGVGGAGAGLGREEGEGWGGMLGALFAGVDEGEGLGTVGWGFGLSVDVCLIACETNSVDGGEVLV